MVAAEIKIYNTTGQLVKSEKAILTNEMNVINFDVKDLAAEIYSVVVNGKNEMMRGDF